MSELLTAAQMAEKLKVSIKTFYRRVRQYNIPYINGGRKLFNPDNVLRCLETCDDAQTLPTDKLKSKRRPPELTRETQRYWDMLDL